MHPDHDRWPPALAAVRAAGQVRGAGRRGQLGRRSDDEHDPAEAAGVHAAVRAGRLADLDLGFAQGPHDVPVQDLHRRDPARHERGRAGDVHRGAAGLGRPAAARLQRQDRARRSCTTTSYGDAVSRCRSTCCRATTRGSARSLRCSSNIDDKFVIFGGGDELTLRFTPPAAPTGDVNRRFLLLSDGYYKDLKQTIDHTVEPLPFAAMSNFPYADDRALPGRRGPPGLPGRVEHALRGHPRRARDLGRPHRRATSGRRDRRRRRRDTPLAQHRPRLPRRGVQADVVHAPRARAACATRSTARRMRAARSWRAASRSPSPDCARARQRSRVVTRRPRTPRTARTSWRRSRRAPSAEHPSRRVRLGERQDRLLELPQPARRHRDEAVREPRRDRHAAARARPTASGTRAAACTRSSARSTTASGPVISQLTHRPASAPSDPTRLRSRWYTNENANGYVDWGTTTAVRHHDEQHLLELHLSTTSSRSLHDRHDVALPRQDDRRARQHLDDARTTPTASRTRA